uniref:Uncharacterized protein n=1 Tax=Eutreptiella gymnastica TaxID=73025 RepID=A0A7S1NEN1_9EUGL
MSEQRTKAADLCHTIATVASSSSETTVAIHFTLLEAMLRQEEGIAAVLAQSISANPSLDPKDAAFLASLALLVEGVVQHRHSKTGDGLRRVMDLHTSAMESLEQTYGTEPFAGPQAAGLEQLPYAAVDLFSSILQYAAQVQISLVSMPPPAGAKRPPDPHSQAIQMLSRALALNRVVSPDDRHNAKAEAIMQVLYDLFAETGLYVQCCGIYNSLHRCLQVLHGNTSDQVLALMHQHQSFLGSIERRKEAGVLAEQIAEVQRQRKVS